MAKFVFKLMPLLEQRRREQRERQRVVAEIEGERLALEEHLRRHQQTIEQGRGALRDMLSPDGATGGVVRSELVRWCAASPVAVDRLARQVVLQLAGVHRRLEQARRQLRMADVRLKAVELLRDKQYERWRDDLDRREASELDEIATMRAARPKDEMTP
jgi:flagellar export protein FliJ